MKKVYENPYLDILYVNNEDILTTSPTHDGDVDDGENAPGDGY